jgi:phosphoribosylanthranilate isomerase
MAYSLKVKICGITVPADGVEAARLGADSIGLNFYQASSRYVTLAQAGQILRELPSCVEAIGVFVNQTLHDVFEHTIHPLGPRIRSIQMHGEISCLPPPHPFRFIPAFAIRDRQSLASIQAYLDQCRATQNLPAAILVDAHVAGHYGGTGQKAPWELLADFSPGVPLWLAGGLNPENIGEAVRVVRPHGVDVASGVEQAPGRKDPEKMRRFISNALEAAARLA